MVIIFLLAIILGIAWGLWLSYAAKNEIREGRRWFILITIVFSLLVIIGAITLGSYPGYIAFLASCLFVAIVSYVCYRKSFSKGLK